MDGASYLGSISNFLMGVHEQVSLAQKTISFASIMSVINCPRLARLPTRAAVMTNSVHGSGRPPEPTI